MKLVRKPLLNYYEINRIKKGNKYEFFNQANGKYTHIKYKYGYNNYIYEIKPVIDRIENRLNNNTNNNKYSTNINSNKQILLNKRNYTLDIEGEALLDIKQEKNIYCEDDTEDIDIIKDIKINEIDNMSVAVSVSVSVKAPNHNKNVSTCNSDNTNTLDFSELIANYIDELDNNRSETEPEEI